MRGRQSRESLFEDAAARMRRARGVVRVKHTTQPGGGSSQTRFAFQSRVNESAGQERPVQTDVSIGPVKSPVRSCAQYQATKNAFECVITRGGKGRRRREGGSVARCDDYTQPAKKSPLVSRRAQEVELRSRRPGRCLINPENPGHVDSDEAARRGGEGEIG